MTGPQKGLWVGADHDDADERASSRAVERRGLKYIFGSGAELLETEELLWFGNNTPQSAALRSERTSRAGDTSGAPQELLSLQLCFPEFTNFSVTELLKWSSNKTDRILSAGNIKNNSYLNVFFFSVLPKTVVWNAERSSLYNILQHLTHREVDFCRFIKLESNFKAKKSLI